MAVPSSGEIKMVGIYSEFNEGDYTALNPEETPISLADLSTESNDTQPQAFNFNVQNETGNRPNETAPHAMSEFYSYNHELNNFGSVIADFTLTAVGGGGLGSAAFSGNKTFTISDDNSEISGSIETPGTNLGVLSLSMSDLGDPGAGGTGNSATGYVTQGTTCNLSLTSAASPKTINCRFKFVPHTSAANQTVDVTFSLSGDLSEATDVVAITKASSRSDRRLKTNIEMIGYSPSNIPIYIFNYKNDLNTKYKGTMAQDLIEMGLSDSVIMDGDGYYSVYYNKIDVDMGIVI